MNTTVAVPVAAPAANAQPTANPPAQKTPVADKSAKPATPPKANDAPPEKFKINVAGKDVEVTLDELKSGYNHHTVAEQKMMEAAETRKRADKALEMLKTDPKAVMKQLGIDPDQWLSAEFQKATKAKLQQIARSKMSPEQIKQVENNEKLAKYEAAERAKQETEQATQNETKHAAMLTALTGVIDIALDKVKLPKTKANYNLVAKELKSMKVSDDDVIGGKIDLSRLVSKLSDRTLANFRALTNNLDPDLLASLLNDDELGKAIKAYSKKKGIELKPKGQIQDPAKRAEKDKQKAFYETLSPAEKVLYLQKRVSPKKK